MMVCMVQRVSLLLVICYSTRDETEGSWRAEKERGEGLWEAYLVLCQIWFIFEQEMPAGVGG